MVGLLLIVVVAGAAIVILKPDLTRKKEAPKKAVGASARPAQPPQKDSKMIGDAITERKGDGAYEVLGDRIRLRSAPAETASVLRTVRQGAFVTIKERPAGSEWCLIQLPGSREGWMRCDFLKPVAQSVPGPTPQATRKETPRP